MRKLQFGAGSLNIEGFENFEQSQVDITKPLPFETGSIDVVFAEMVLEHVTPKEAWGFIDEAYRIIKLEGLIRLVIPDFLRCWRLRERRVFAWEALSHTAAVPSRIIRRARGNRLAAWAGGITGPRPLGP